MKDLRCPKCGRPTIDRGQGLGYCHSCGLEFDSEDDGVVTYGDPARIVANLEAKAIADKKRRAMYGRAFH